MVLLVTLIAAPAVGAFLGMLFNKMASKEFLDLFKKWKFNDKLLPELKFALLTVSAVLSDAEDKQITNPSVKEWLDELKDAVYDAEDVLDEITAKGFQSKMETKSQTKKSQGKKDEKDEKDGSNFTKEIESKVEKIIERLKSIAQHKDVLGLREEVPSVIKFPSTSLVDESQIFGRETDKKVILGFLLPTIHDANGIPSYQVPVASKNKVSTNDEKEILVANKNELAADESKVSTDDNVVMTDEKEDSVTNEPATYENELAADKNEVLPANESEDLSTNENGVLTNEHMLMTDDMEDPVANKPAADKKKVLTENESEDLSANEYGVSANEKILMTDKKEDSAANEPAENEYELAEKKNEVPPPKNENKVPSNEGEEDLSMNVNGVQGKNNEVLAATEVVVQPANENQVPVAKEDETQAEEKELATNGDEIPVVAIVGMPGVGKTTLAQLLFNDKRVKGIFRPRVWVHVSEEFDILKITRTVYESLTCGQLPTAADLNTLQVKLQAKLKKKKFLLVLDDIWNENFVDWDVLLRPFRAANCQSRIIVTTRSSNVASSMCAAHIYNLSCLSHEDCWSLFAKHAFHLRTFYRCPEMKEIGEKIVKKCNGLPLAAKTLGALLYNKTELDEWVGILNSEIWDLPSDKSNILPALRLSYYQLPSHLKRCFAYCSIFPKGFQFEKEHLILLWMAEGLLLQSRSKKLLADVGDEYFRELLSKSFFQQLIHHHHDGKQYYVMHDLFSDLARSVAGEFCFKSEDGILHEVSKKVRYFSFTAGKFDTSDKFDAFQGANHLRTFLPLKSVSSQGQCNLSPSAFAHMLQAFNRLRVLSLRDYQIVELHESVGNLKYLRYLDLSGTQIKELKEYVCSLFNLETLLLSRCSSLTKLPENMQKLINLHHLDISGTEVTEMPMHFGGLKSLHVLNSFVVGTNGSCISELKELSNLRTLSILRLGNVRGTDALSANLKGKLCLSELVLHWLKIKHAQNALDVLQQLQPHKNLKKLNIENYCGTTFPNWLTNGSISTLVSLHLIDCGNCLSLPPLGQLSSLKELHIVKMKQVKTMDAEFCRSAPSSIEPFRSLEILKFEDMPVLSSFIVEEQLPSLEELHLSKCPELTGNLPKHLPSLKTLHISKCGKLKMDFLQDKTEQQYKVLKSLDIRSSCDSLISFPLGYFTKLENFQIQGCKNLKLLEMSLHRFLQELSIQDCPKLAFSPGVSLPTPNLASLSISNCNSLASLPEQMHSLTSLQALMISECSGLPSFKDGDLPANLQLLSIENCPHFTPQVQWNLQNMASLKSFKIEGGCSDMESFPEDRLLPTSLTSLQITDLQDLQSLNHMGLGNLTRLETLKIYCCDNLKCISEERLPLSLSHLEISGCDNLIQQCKEGGEDWDKISHISKIIIDDEEI